MKPLFAIASLVLAATAQAQVVNIDQAKAMAGGVTPGDAPGFPITISQPGSYRLTGDLSVTDPAVHGIEINAAGSVTLDLGGFTIRGPRCGASRCTINPPPVNGIYRYGYVSPVPIITTLILRDGRIENFGGAGVWASGGLDAQRMVVVGNGDGIVTGGVGRVVDSMVSNNVGWGMRMLAGNARGNQVWGNGAGQMRASNGAVLVSGNTLLGPNPLDAGGTVGPISLGDNLCAPQGYNGQRC
jgi:hypothetical protein